MGKKKRNKQNKNSGSTKSNSKQHFNPHANSKGRTTHRKGYAKPHEIAAIADKIFGGAYFCLGNDEEDAIQNNTE